MPGRKIIAAVDLHHKDADRHVVNEAILMAKMHATEVEICFVIPDQQNSFVQSYIPAEMRQQVELGANQEIISFASEFDWDGLRHSAIVLRGIVYETLVERALKDKAHSIVIGASKPGIKELFLGPNAARVARHAPCNVLVVRP